MRILKYFQLERFSCTCIFGIKIKKIFQFKLFITRRLTNNAKLNRKLFKKYILYPLPPKKLELLWLTEPILLSYLIYTAPGWPMCAYQEEQHNVH